MRDIAIDVGSGVTKVRAENVKKHFLSLSGVPEAQGFDLDEHDGSTVKFGRKTYVVGETAKSLVHPDHLANTRDDNWFKSDGFLALMYAAIAKAIPEEYSGKIYLCTGLPQALYNENKDALVKRLAVKHKFTVDGRKYIIHLRKDDIQVMPQVMGLFLSRLALEHALQVQKVALIDVGTYTSDWTIIEDGKTIQWAAGGVPIGVSTVINAISDYLRTDLRMNCTDAAINDAIRTKQILSGNSIVDLADRIDQTVFDCAAEMIETVDTQWRGAKDAKIVVGGGGGALFASAIRVKFPHAQLIADAQPIYSVVDGYYAYINQRRNRIAA